RGRGPAPRGARGRAGGGAPPPVPPPASTMSRQDRPVSAASDVATACSTSSTRGVPATLSPHPPAAAVAVRHRMLRSTVVSPPDISRLEAVTPRGVRNVPPCPFG